MFLPFLYELRRRKVPIGTQEALALAAALKKGLHESSLEGFYHVARALLVHSETQLDAFDQAFAVIFKGAEDAGVELTRDLLAWLQNARQRVGELTPEERALYDSLSLDELREMFEERLREQKERHDGGSKWIGTGGKSPFGHSGAARKGVRVGGPGANRSAVQVAEERRFQSYRDDLVLDVRQLSVALRKLRAFAREGGEEELDLEETIAQTSRNAGELEVVTRPPRRSNTRVVLLMDVGGSMDPYAALVSRLFSAASKATHFKELRTYYFHNCVYGRVFKTDGTGAGVPVRDLLHECGKHYKLIIVGDGLMAPYELFMRGGGIGYNDEDSAEGYVWLMTLAQHFENHVWLNPEPVRGWHGNTIEEIRHIFPMFQLTLEGLGEAVSHLTRGRATKP
ncbi:MAG: vWA domain-containing protein [Myxococcaceae bacterium]